MAYMPNVYSPIYEQYVPQHQVFFIADVVLRLLQMLQKVYTRRSFYRSRPRPPFIISSVFKILYRLNVIEIILVFVKFNFTYC